MLTILTDTMSIGGSLRFISDGHAHHGEVTSRVNTRTGWGGLGERERSVLGLNFRYHYQDFGRALNDTQPYERAPLGEVHAHAFATRAQLKLSPRFGVSALIPLSLLEIITPNAERERAWGFGDVELALDWFAFKTGRARLTITLGASAPTGRYAELKALSVTEVKGDDQGMFSLTRYQAQASLGSGAWMARAQMRGAVHIGDLWCAELSALVRTPLSRTPDDLLWGADFEVMSGVTRRLGQEAQALIGLSWGEHTRDQMSALAQSEEMGEDLSAWSASGSRREVALWLGVSSRVTSALICELTARLPMWQRVEGVQLVERVSGGVGCQWLWGDSSAQAQR